MVSCSAVHKERPAMLGGGREEEVGRQERGVQSMVWHEAASLFAHIMQGYICYICLGACYIYVEGNIIFYDLVDIMQSGTGGAYMK